MNPFTQQAWKQFWNVTAESTNPLCAIDLPEITQQTYQSASIRVSQLLDLSAHDIVLNIGCGPGLFEERYATEVKHIIGIDFVYTMVDKARHRNHAVHNAAFFQASGTTLPFKEGLFSKILCYSVLHYFSEDEVIQLLNETRRVSSKGALVLLGDVEDVSGSAAEPPLSRVAKVWTPGEVAKLMQRGTRRIHNEVSRRVARLRRQWQTYAGQYIVAPKPLCLFNYSRDHLLALATAAGYDGWIVEQGAERFVPGRYHVVLQVSEQVRRNVP